MANEARVTAGLQIIAGNINYLSQPSAFLATVTGRKGPTPGSISVAVLGTDVDLSQLTQPGLCILHNQDPTNFVTYGIRDPETNRFYPLGELLPGEIYPLRLSRDIQEEYGTGTGTVTAATNKLHLRANTAACNVLVGAFEV